MPADEVLLDDYFQHFRGAGVIPCAFWINDGDGAVEADAQAIRLGAEDFGIFATGEVELLEAGFEKFPGCEAGFFGATFRFRLIGTKEDVAFDFTDAEGGCAVMEIVHLEGMVTKFQVVANLNLVWSLTLSIPR